MRLLTWLLVAGLLFSAACGNSDDDDAHPVEPLVATELGTIVTTPDAPSATCGDGKEHEAGQFDETLQSSGLTREYILHIPAGYNGSEVTPVVLLFHGFALDGRIMLDYSGLSAIADRERFIVASPTGTGDPHHWNTFAGATPDDVLFVNDLLDKLEAQLCIDTARVFATGYSNGGGMSMDLSCNVPQRVRAVGLVAAVYLPCTPKTPLIAFHGTEDTLVAFEGGGNSGPDEGGFSFPSIRDSITSWAAALGCGATPDVSDPAEHVELSVYSDCTPGGDAVQFYVVDAGGHSWPGAKLFNNAVATTQEIDATELIWEFFAKQLP